MKSDDIEILVHISGPSCGKDDVRYRAEARNLLDWEPRERHDVLVPSRIAADVEGGEISGHDILIVGDEAEDLSVRTIGTTTTTTSTDPTQRAERIRQLMHSQLEHDIIVEHSDGPETEALIRRDTRFTSLVQDASASKGRPYLLIERTPTIPRPQSAPQLEISAITGGRQTKQAGSWDTPPNVVPDSQPERSSNGHKGQVQDQSEHLHARTDSVCPSMDPSQADFSVPSQKRKTAQAQANINEGDDERQNAVDSEMTLQGGQATRLQASSTSALSRFEIHPPRPRIARQTFKTHITPALADICQKASLDKYFTRSRTESRALETLERGHWLVPLTGWNLETIASFWNFLNMFIGRGKAGWGVWCMRETCNRDPLASPDKGATSSSGLAQIIRVYCWGEVVGHIWIVLLIASGKAVRGSGAAWIDSRGEAVIQMT